MSAFQLNPVKLYIQDIYRAERSADNKYIYSLFGLSFKNICIHGIITGVSNTISSSKHFEITDPTGTIQVFYDAKRSNSSISDRSYNNLKQNLNDAVASGSGNIAILRTLHNAVAATKQDITDITIGDYYLVIGDVFSDSVKNTRMFSAYECHKTSAERDIVWLNELKYIYDKYYIKSLENYMLLPFHLPNLGWLIIIIIVGHNDTDCCSPICDHIKNLDTYKQEDQSH